MTRAKNPPPEGAAPPGDKPPTLEDAVSALAEAVAAIASVVAQLAVGPAELLSATQAAALLGVGRDKFRDLTRLKEFPGAVGFGHHESEVLMYRRADLLRYISRLKVKRS